MIRVTRVRLAVVIDAMRRSFWLLPVIAMIVGGGLGFAVPELDADSNGAFGVFSTSDVNSARGILETIATVTVSVAGIAFSVTVVALQLASQQLGPRVLRTFQTDRLSQSTLAVFLGTFVYALIALGRLVQASAQPNLVLTVALVIVVAAFVLFAVFIQNVINTLQASTIIRRIAAEAVEAMTEPYPCGIGEPAEGGETVAGDRDPMDEMPIRATRAGFLIAIDGERLIAAARDHGGLIVQRIPVGDFVTSGTELARARSPSDAQQLAAAVRNAFRLGEERTVTHDHAFPIRQLTDVALRALSPSLNDPTTAENACGSLTEALLAFAERDPVVLRRADGDGAIRFIARAPDFDDLVRLGFEQVSVHGTDYPVLQRRLLDLLDRLRDAARQHGCSLAESERHAGLLRRQLEDEPDG